MSQCQIEPYLMFGGRCEEALKFYEQALGAQIEMMMRYSESPAPPPPGSIPPGFEEKVMHSSFVLDGARVMASDGMIASTQFTGFSLAISLSDQADMRRKFEALAQGGQVTMPLAATFWSPLFGMVKDPFGVHWMLMVVGEPSR